MGRSDIAFLSGDRALSLPGHRLLRGQVHLQGHRPWCGHGHPAGGRRDRAARHHDLAECEVYLLPHFPDRKSTRLNSSHVSILFPYTRSSDLMFEWVAQTLRSYPEIALFLSLGIGYYVGKFTFKGIGLGAVTATLLAAVVIGQLGITISPNVKSTFFLIFLFAVGYGVGPQFVRDRKSVV